MKKLLLVIVAVIGLSFAANAQNIGVRLGGGQGYGAELSYQQALGGANRLELDLGYYGGYGYSHLGLNAIYQLHFDINAVPNLGWYAGVGGRIDLYTYSDASIAAAILGQAGLDYEFANLPLQLSLDIRPAFYLYPATSFYWGDVALGIRYRL